MPRNSPRNSTRNRRTSRNKTQRKVLLSNTESDRVTQIMNEIKREYFSPPGMRVLDSPMQIGENQTISARNIHKEALIRLSPVFSLTKPCVLDVGSGSGYLTACLGLACQVSHPDYRKRGKVIGIDIFPSLVDMSRQTIRHYYPHLMRYTQSFGIKQGDGKRGYPSYSSEHMWDAIHIGAECKEIPAYLYAQLRKGGIMVLPLKTHTGTKLYTIQKKTETRYIQTDPLPVRFVPLL